MQQDSTPQQSESGQASQPTVSLGSVLVRLALLGLASPFLALGEDPFHGLIGLVILFVGIRIAWRMTKGSPAVVISGPFNSTTAATA